MKGAPHLYWDEKIVMSYLRHAASIHRRLPEVKVQGYFSLWPQAMQDEWEKFYDALNGKSSLGSPMAAEVTFHEEVMALLPYLDRREQQIIWMRASKAPWKLLVEEMGRSKATLHRDLIAALSRLVVRLNQIDPKGEYFSRLQRRANGYLQVDETLRETLSHIE